MDEMETVRASIDADKERELLVRRYGQTAVNRIEANLRKRDSLTPAGKVCPSCLRIILEADAEREGSHGYLESGEKF